MFYISTENDKNSPDIKWKKKKKNQFLMNFTILNELFLTEKILVTSVLLTYHVKMTNQFEIFLKFLIKLTFT
jgi:hypothetical protein